MWDRPYLGAHITNENGFWISGGFLKGQSPFSEYLAQFKSLQ